MGVSQRRAAEAIGAKKAKGLGERSKHHSRRELQGATSSCALGCVVRDDFDGPHYPSGRVTLGRRSHDGSAGEDLPRKNYGTHVGWVLYLPSNQRVQL
jgi:hypothetical protein